MKQNKKWVKRWRSWIATKPSLPGVWRRKEGGFLVRARPLDGRTGKQREVRLTLPEANDAREAFAMLQAEVELVRRGEQALPPARIRFEDFSVSLLERKALVGDHKSAKTAEIWASILTRHLIPSFGDHYIDDIRRSDIEAWKTEKAMQIRSEKYSPHYCNSQLRILRVIFTTAVAELELERNPILGIRNFDVSEHPPFTEEEPNSLSPDEVPTFLVEMARQFPQHLAFVALGFSLGLRPSSLRPLRRKGDSPDLLWEENRLLVRRSQTRGARVMNTTKTGKRQSILLPDELMGLLRWHVDRLPEGPMRVSDLIFPAINGGFRSSSCLAEPFRAVCSALKMKKRLTPKGMRRTFQDLARQGEVKDIVTRAISGHATEAMQHHYSTVAPEEIRRGVAEIVSITGLSRALEAA